MFIDKDSIQVKTSSMENYISLGQYLVEVKFDFNKLWSPDSGRNLAGKQSGTLTGIFPKIVCEFGRLTQAQLETLAPILDSPRQSLKYYDPTKQATVTLDTYTGDYEITNKHIISNNATNEGFSVSFIAIEKRP